ncbi:sensor histidine kinase [Ohtaekwangia koreensis]|uniref:histidine kinase n=1 Tax=Ohtaekwangia koreensis TaxID=688867 RepID=A0A1T5JAM9_9BACT|nr:HAMP domain-containing sensor histidine kinase [Ohtaekwangia koreensis]SKC48481.1 Signal transduction histidine kinase [Ohtaekwangia koreensis]
MKIRQRLALRFMFVSALITGTILIIIYFFTRGFVHADFIDRLTQQSSLEVLHYASPQVRDVMPSGTFNLVNPSISIFSESGTLLHRQGDFHIPDTWVTFLKTNDLFNAERGEYSTVGRKHVINGNLYLIFVSDKDLPGERELNFLLRAIIAGWIISLVLSYLTGLYFSGNALQPMKHVVNEVNQITQDNLGYRLKMDKDAASVDEIDELILTFNALLTRIERAFITQKRFVQNASHELKTPLTAIMAEVELALARDRSMEEYRRTLHVVLQETERLASTTQELLLLARLEERAHKTELDSVDVIEVLDRTLASFSLHHPEREVVKEGKTSAVYIQGNAQLLQTAFLNILDNAYKYSNDKIKITLTSKPKEIAITIRDFGIGIPSSELNQVRSPLYRGSNASTIPGAGLGLSLVDRIISVNNGQFEIYSEEGKGTACVIKLPVI